MSVQIARNGEVIGTFEASAIPGLVQSGQILGTDNYWTEGMTEWKLVALDWQPAAMTSANSASGKLSTLAVVALVLGILALVSSWIMVGGLFGFFAILCGHFALSDAKKQNSVASHNLALVGTILGYVATAIAVAVLAIQILAMSQAVSESRKERVQADFAAIATQLRTYQMMAGAFPTKDQGLRALVAEPSTGVSKRWTQLMEKVPVDPWGNEYVYSSEGEAITLISAGPDGKQGTADDISNR